MKVRKRPKATGSLHLTDAPGFSVSAVLGELQEFMAVSSVSPFFFLIKKKSYWNTPILLVRMQNGLTTVDLKSYT